MRVLVVGGGGREHALAWKLTQSRRVEELFVAPGNAGTAGIAHNLPVQTKDIQGMLKAAREHRVDLTVVGPEAPLAEGIVDLFRSRDMPVFGPTKGAARIESSKAFAREIMQSGAVPCAGGQTFSSAVQAKEYIASRTPPVVVKADGLAAGKGVLIAQSREEAFEAVRRIMDGRLFGAAGERVVVEEFLTGPEVSLLAFVDGTTVVPMVPACDYKKAFDGDRGPNTGGMGSYSPPGFFSEAMIARVRDSVFIPVVRSLGERDTPYSGVLYAGLILTPDGPKVLEFNARFGDPEAQALLPRLKTDLVEVMMAVVEGRLSSISLEWSAGPCIAVVLASGGYPGEYEKGYPITGLDSVERGVLVFHSGTKLDDGRMVTDGGRVLTVAATDRSMADARDKVYASIPRVRFQGCHYRKDIALREVS